MKIIKTTLLNTFIIEPHVFNDDRGYFYEIFNNKRFQDNNLPETFLQDNISESCANVLRGLHFQTNHPQGKLVQCLIGMIYDVAVDIRQNSPTFGKYFGIILSENNKKQLYIPPGCAHGFIALNEKNLVNYKCTELYDPSGEQTIIWNDPTIGIKWPINNPILSEKDKKGKLFKELFT